MTAHPLDLGFRLNFSFESLRYREIWMLNFALMVLSDIADGCPRLRRSTAGRVLRRNRSRDSLEPDPPP